MAKGNFKTLLTIVVLGCVLGSCSTTKSKYQREYTQVWKEIIKSEAWKNSLVAKNSNEKEYNSDFVAINEDDVLADDGLSTKLNLESLFEERFHSLVSRAYFKIISEAENADTRLSAEYERWNRMQANEGLKKDRDFKKKYEVVTKKYHAHKQMLEGLKSWNIFSEYRSNDLDFFKAENKVEIQSMYDQGSTEDQMISYLVYRLADLYHYE
ncbi:hypothetical protein [Maribacter sp. HTCC2170]|uniref:hypothetical protein n=1 Tax=Maribacter sp. (strain HTCC2170 / KCCM 42371) TaxID=313603 RepID=UPI00006BD50C|nr:hypothetical protein [Maribacter sp. HTCC2170]EAR02875.1 hypothetical protein FB2170_06290 [Maribacter sp. HTCC2170]